jgi:U3 small nucleolar RNA-associated protein 10
LQAFKGYLHLIADAVSERHKISDALFSLNEKQPVQIDNTVNILLSALAELATNKVLHGHVGKAFRKSRDPTKARALFANIVDTTIQLSKKVTQKRKLHEACNQILANCLALLPTVDLVKTAELILANPDHQVQIAVVKSIEVRAGSVTQNDHLSVSSLLAFLPRANDLLQQSSEVEVAVHAISCMDCIIERFGKKDVSIVTEITRTLASTQALASKHDRLRVLSLICLTSAIGVLEEEAIALLPTVLPIAFEYLRKSIENRNQSLHNAVFELLSNIVQRLSFIFSREYLTTAIELSQRSAAAELNEACDKNRQQFYQIVSIHITAQEAFTAMKATWASALGHGFKVCVLKYYCSVFANCCIGVSRATQLGIIDH